MKNGTGTLNESSEKTPIAELEFLGIPSRIIAIVEIGLGSVWLEDLPTGEALNKRLMMISQIGPYWAVRIIRAIEKNRR